MRRREWPSLLLTGPSLGTQARTEARSVHKEHSDCRAQAGGRGEVTSEAAVSGTSNGPSCLGKILADIYKPQGPQAKRRLSQLPTPSIRTPTMQFKFSLATIAAFVATVVAVPAVCTVWVCLTNVADPSCRLRSPSRS